MRVAMSLVVLLSVLTVAVSLPQTSYGISNHAFELDWGESGKINPGNFLFPQRIAEGNDGSVYVTDLGNSRIQVFDDSGNFTKAWGINGSDPGEFNSPQGIAVSENFVFVSDNKLNKIQKFDLDGNFVLQWGTTGKSNGEFKSPRGLFIDNDSLFVADTGNNRVQKFTFDGEYVSGFGKKGIDDSSFRSPVDLAVDSTGNIFVADDRLKKIVKYSPDYELLKTFDGRYGGFPIAASGVDIDKNGNLIILGGRDGSGNLNIVRFFDMQNLKWFYNDSLPINTSGHVGEFIKEKIHIIGGEDIFGKKVFDDHWFFDFEKNKWFESKQLPIGLHGMGSGVIRNKLYLFGGATGAGTETYNTVQNKNYMLKCY